MTNLNSILDKSWTRLDCDVLILGSGLAGLLLSVLLHERGANVVLASKENFSDSNTFYAQGGLAAVTSSQIPNLISEHLNDTIKSGAGLTDIKVASEIIASAPYLVQQLSRFGMEFDRNSDGTFEMALEGGHSKARVLHSKDTTGKAISNALLKTAREKAASQPAFELIEYCYAFNLLNDGQKVIGAEVLHDGVIKQISAGHVVLATGGVGQIFSRTTNPLVATADGVALAYRSGAMLADLEFVQFHPTALALPGAPAFLISEAVRGAGAILKDDNGNPFVRNFHPDGDLATRDVVARAIHQTMIDNNLPSVNLDLRPIGKRTLLKRFPNIIETCRRFGVDPLQQAVPVCPAAHYFMGGVLSDACGRTSLPGLYAIGEVACTGLHGANRLASNSLLEAGVMAVKLADLLIGGSNSISCAGGTTPQSLSKTKPGMSNGALNTTNKALNTSSPKDNWDVPTSLPEFKTKMYEHASLVRSHSRLHKLLDYIQSNRGAAVSINVANISSANLLLVGELIATAANNRTESRGAHFREDFPGSNDTLFARRQAVSLGSWDWLDESKGFAKIDKQSTFPA